MYDYGLSVLEQYEVTVKNSFRGRGALLCQTDRGLLLIREFNGSVKKLERQQELLEEVKRSQKLSVDVLLSNREGALCSTDGDGITYTVRQWYEGRECDTGSREDILRGVRALGQLHNAMRLPSFQEYAAESLEEEYVRHNRELQKIRKFIRQKRRKNEFETAFLSSVDYFLERGAQAVELLRASDYPALRAKSAARGDLCHGDYSQHNVRMLRGREAVTNFERWTADLQTADLYRFLRKILEKYNWDERLAAQMLNAYENVRPLSDGERQNLGIRFCYPEKYWKLANYYYTHNKAWISGKNIEKLNRLVEQKKMWENFGKKYFGN